MSIQNTVLLVEQHIAGFVRKQTLSQLSHSASLPEVERVLQGRPISRADCSSGTVWSPYQRVCGWLAAGKPCTSHFHSTHTPLSPAAGMEPLPLHFCLHVTKQHGKT